MGRRVLRRHILGYLFAYAPLKGRQAFMGNIVAETAKNVYNLYTTEQQYKTLYWQTSTFIINYAGSLSKHNVT